MRALNPSFLRENGEPGLGRRSKHVRHAPCGGGSLHLRVNTAACPGRRTWVGNLKASGETIWKSPGDHF